MGCGRIIWAICGGEQRPRRQLGRRLMTERQGSGRLEAMRAAEECREHLEAAPRNKHT